MREGGRARKKDKGGSWSYEIMPPRGSRRKRNPSNRRRRRDSPQEDEDLAELAGPSDGSADLTVVAQAQKIPLSVVGVDEALKDVTQRYIEARARSKRIRRHLEIEEGERGVDHLYLVLHDILDDIDFIMDKQLTICQLDPGTKDDIHTLVIAAEKDDQGIDVGIGKAKIRIKRVWFSLIATAALTAFLKIVISDIAGIPLPFIG